MSCIIPFGVVSLPVSVMFLFVQMEVCHAEACDVSKCHLLLLAPRCNFRCVAPCRIEEMPTTKESYDDGAAKILLCTTTVGCTQAINGYSLIDFVKPYDNCPFSFNNLDPSIGKTVKLMEEILKKKDEKMEKKNNDEETMSTSQPIEHFEDALDNITIEDGQEGSGVTVGSNELSQYLVKLSSYFNEFRTEKDYEELYNILMESYGVLLNETMKKKCNQVSNYIIKTVLAFQHLTPLRMTYIEGNHRHVKLFCAMSGVQILESNEDGLLFVRSTAAVPTNNLSECNLDYAIKIARKDSSNILVVQEAVQQSLKYNDQQAKAVTQELCHR